MKKNLIRVILIVFGGAVLMNRAHAQVRSAESDFRRARDEQRKREERKEKSVVNTLHSSIIPQFAKLEGMTVAKIDKPKFWPTTSTYFSHMTLTNGRACEIQVHAGYRAFEFDDLQDLKTFFRVSRAKTLSALCGREETKAMVTPIITSIENLASYAQTYGTDNEEYQNLYRLTLSSANLRVLNYQNKCDLEPWSILATCLSGRGKSTHSRALLKSPKGILFDR